MALTNGKCEDLSYHEKLDLIIEMFNDLNEKVDQILERVNNFSIEESAYGIEDLYGDED